VLGQKTKWGGGGSKRPPSLYWSAKQCDWLSHVRPAPFPFPLFLFPGVESKLKELCGHKFEPAMIHKFDFLHLSGGAI